MSPVTMLDIDRLPKKGLYSHAAELSPHSRILYIGGRCGIDESGKVVSPDIGPQFTQAFTNIGRVLAAAGMGYENLARLTTYLTTEDDIEGFYEARANLFADIYPLGKYPPNTLLIVSRLVDPTFRIEIDSVAAA
jgi:2-iminobutanoate/2-iminopropanoate deaminase